MPVEDRGGERLACAPMPANRDKPTVSLGVTYAVVDTYECDDGRISPTRCAIIAAGLDGRWSPHRACRTPPVGACSTHSGLAGGSRRASPADLGGFPQSKTTRRSRTRPCGDASPAKWVGSGRVTLRHVSPIPPLDPCVRLSSHTAHERGDFTGNFHFTNSTDFTVVSLRIRWLPLYRFPYPLPKGLCHVRGFPAFRLLCPI